MDIASKIIFVIFGAFLGMVGGQCWKFARRYLLPIVIASYTYSKKKFESLWYIC